MLSCRGYLGGPTLRGSSSTVPGGVGSGFLLGRGWVRLGNGAEEALSPAAGCCDGASRVLVGLGGTTRDRASLRNTENRCWNTKEGRKEGREETASGAPFLCFILSYFHIHWSCLLFCQLLPFRNPDSAGSHSRHALPPPARL